MSNKCNFCRRISIIFDKFGSSQLTTDLLEKMIMEDTENGIIQYRDAKCSYKRYLFNKIVERIRISLEEQNDPIISKKSNR